MTSEQLHCFMITAKYLNFSAAAKELYITQPAISHQISLLEKELGTRLFIRSTRKVQLTRSGELFLEDAKRILDISEAARERIHLADTAENIRLRISYLLAPCKGFLPQVLAEFKKVYPQVVLELTRMDARNITTAMRDDTDDIYFSLSGDFKTHPEYASKELFTDTFCLICSREHPCANLTKIDFNKLASERFLFFDPENAALMFKQVQHFCRSVNFRPHMMEYRSSMDEILFEVESGLGVTILPMKNKVQSSDSVVYIPLTGNFSQLSFGVAWRIGTDNPAIGWFLELLDQLKNKHPEWF